MRCARSRASQAIRRTSSGYALDSCSHTDTAALCEVLAEGVGHVLVLSLLEGGLGLLVGGGAGTLAFDRAACPSAAAACRPWLEQGCLLLPRFLGRRDIRLRFLSNSCNRGSAPISSRDPSPPARLLDEGNADSDALFRSASSAERPCSRTAISVSVSTSGSRSERWWPRRRPSPPPPARLPIAPDSA